MSKKQSTETKFLSGLISIQSHTFAKKKNWRWWWGGNETVKRSTSPHSKLASGRAQPLVRIDELVASALDGIVYSPTCFYSSRQTHCCNKKTNDRSISLKQDTILYHSTFMIIVQFMYLLLSSTFPMWALLSNSESLSSVPEPSSSSAILKHGHSKITVKKVHLIRFVWTGRLTSC